MASDVRNVVASVVGWLIVGIVLFLLLTFVLGALGFLLRSLVWLVLIGLLVAAYLKLKEPPDV